MNANLCTTIEVMHDAATRASAALENLRSFDFAAAREDAAAAFAEFRARVDAFHAALGELNAETAAVEAQAPKGTRRKEPARSALVLYAIEDEKTGTPLEMLFSRAMARQELHAYGKHCRVHPYDAVRRPNRKGGGA
jgi:hypothetical protein